MHAPTALRDARVLVVEDEYVVADALCRDLEAIGVRVLGPVGSVHGALEALEANTALDGAILDVRLGGEAVYPVAGVLESRAVPFVFWTGAEPDARPLPHAGVRRVAKPGSSGELVRALLAERRRAQRQLLADVYASGDGESWLLQVRAQAAPEHVDDHAWLGACLLDLHEWSLLLRVPLRRGVFYRVPQRCRVLLGGRLSLLG